MVCLRSILFILAQCKTVMFKDLWNINGDLVCCKFLSLSLSIPPWHTAEIKN